MRPRPKAFDITFDITSGASLAENAHYPIITLASFTGLRAFVVCATNYFVLYCERRMREGRKRGCY